MLSIWTSPHPPVDSLLVATLPGPVARWQSTNKVDVTTRATTISFIAYTAIADNIYIHYVVVSTYCSSSVIP